MRVKDTESGLYIDITESDIQAIRDQAEFGLRHGNSEYYEYWPTGLKTDRATYVRLSND